MNERVWILLGLILVSCAQVPAEESAAAPVIIEEAPPAQPADLIRPRRTAAELLSIRPGLCERAWEVPAKPPRGDIEAELNTLMLASCRPEAAPGLINHLLASLTQAGTWPADYAGLFDLILAHQKAYAVMERLYTDLRQTHQQLQQAHTKTIEGLGQIEVDIEQQAATPTPVVPQAAPAAEKQP